MPEPKSPFKRVRRNFDQEALKRVCEMHELQFADAYGMDVTICREMGHMDEYEDFYAFKDNGSDILAVAHLDTVMAHSRRTAHFVETEAGLTVYSGALDDRLGAYTILELLPKLGIQYDILLTTGEESGASTAQFYKPEKEYNWVIEFDRGGTDVVMYQYDDRDTRELVKASGATVGDGIFSDISYMDGLEVKCFNWGVGYRDYHGPRSHAYLEDYWRMIGHYLKFHEANCETYLPHERSASWYGLGSRWGSASYYGGSRGGGSDAWWDDDDRWTDRHWDAYINGGLDAVIELGEPSDDDDVIDVVLDDDGELISEDFETVNRELEENPGSYYRSYN